MTGATELEEEAQPGSPGVVRSTAGLGATGGGEQLQLKLSQGTAIAAWLDEQSASAQRRAKQLPRNSSDRAILAGAAAAYERAAIFIRGETMTSDA